MRDKPLVLSVAWGRNQTRLDLLCRWQKIERTMAPQKKEKPRGNGAYDKGKQ